ncbi:MAG: SH3 domain-containing protein [bacterium]|nr:SH3 domain-containing protein [bacterium]
MTDEKRYREMIKKKDQEIIELKELLAEAETEIKELNDFHGFSKPKGTILESQLLNKLIKRTAFLLICLVIVLIGLYPWFFKDTLLGDNDKTSDEQTSAEEVADDSTDMTNDQTDAVVQNEPEVVDSENQPETSEGRDIFSERKLVEVSSDLGWLNVRTEPDVETGDIIKKLNSGEEYEWLEKTDTNWYKLVIDDAGHTGYVSGEYVVEK